MTRPLDCSLCPAHQAKADERFAQTLARNANWTADEWAAWCDREWHAQRKLINTHCLKERYPEFQAVTGPLLILQDYVPPTEVLRGAESDEPIVITLKEATERLTA